MSRLSTVFTWHLLYNLPIKIRKESIILDVYADLFFLINFSMDYICLYITGKILRLKVSATKYIISSIIGGAYSVIALFWNVGTILAFIIDILVCIIMTAICFYHKGDKVKSIVTASLLYIGISMLIGGVMTAIFNLLNKLEINFESISADGAHTYTFAIIAVISAVLSMKGISLITRKNRHKEYLVEIIINKKTGSFLGFVDTGNLVKDHISGKSIIFIDKSAASKIIDPDAEEKFYQGEILYRSSRLVPISTATGSSATLIFVPDKITLIETNEKNATEFQVDCLIALTKINKGDGYEAIIPEDIIKLNI